MSIRNLQDLLEPASVAVIGASVREGAVGHVVFRNMERAGFAGPLYPVNPKYDHVMGRRCFARVADLPEAPELAVIATPAQTVPGLVAELAERGTRAVVVLSAGISEASGLRQPMLDAARPTLLRIVGPNSLGLISPRAGVNASFAHMGVKAGGLALVSQSGAIATALIDWANAQNIGFSSVISLGNMADVDAGDCLDLLARDRHSKAILLYLESIPHPRKFISAARAASRLKPVIVLKPGRHEVSARAAATHTGALSGADRVVEAVLRRAGIIRVRDLDELFLAAEATVRFPPQASTRIGLVTNGGGAGVLATDQLADENLPMANLSRATLARLEAELPAAWSRANPVDIIGDAPAERYRSAVQAVAEDPAVDVVMVMNCPTGLSASADAAEAVAGLARRGRIGGKPVLACWLGEATARDARTRLEQAGIASFETPARTARAAGFMGEWSRTDKLLGRIPAYHPDRTRDIRDTVATTLRDVADEGRSLLTEPEAKSVLAAYNIPTTECAIAEDAVDAGRMAARMLPEHGSLVLKLLSRDISHKSDVGGVALDLTSASAVDAKAREMLLNAGRRRPDALIDGFVLQPMIRRKQGYELIAGLSRDPQFGPVVMFGAGGTAVEVIADTVIGLPPLDEVLAGDMIDQTRIGRLLNGYRDRPAADRRAIIDVLLSISRLITDFGAISALDINPLLADNKGVVALDARIEIDPQRLDGATPNPDLLIRAYPAAWERSVTLNNRHTVDIRPIMPRDSSLYADFMARTPEADIRARMFVAKRELTADELRRLTQLDYDREMALVALDAGEDGALAGVARLAADPDHRECEFGLIVRGDRQGEGLGRALLELLIDYATEDGLETMFGLVLKDNTRMLKLCADVGFKTRHLSDEPGTVRVELRLGEHQGKP